MKDHFSLQGHPVSAHLVGRLTVPPADQTPAGSYCGFDGLALSADPSIPGALTLLLQQIEQHNLNHVICPTVLSHAKRVHDGTYQAAMQDAKPTFPEILATCERRLVALAKEQVALPQTQDAWQRRTDLTGQALKYNYAVQAMHEALR